MSRYILLFLLAVSFLITWILISFGATVRLYGAGLACPDWPLCYGSLIPPINLQIALEVGHRYLASFLGLLILIAYFLCWRPELTNYRRTAGLLFFLVLLQGIIGGLTVLLKLNFATVVLHLLLGNLLFLCLVYLLYEVIFLSTTRIKYILAEPTKFYFQTKFIVAIYFLMLLSGGLNSSNYAGYACSAFPLCTSNSSFSFFWDSSSVSLLWNNWQGFAFSVNILEAIHLIHRIVVVCGSILLIYFSIKCLLPKKASWAFWGYILILLILLEVLVGIINALFFVPIPVSILHTTIASSITGVLALILVKARHTN